MKVIDTHCHLNFKVFRENYRQVIDKALASDMGLIIVGAAKDTSERAVMIAHEYERDPVFAAVGQHPTHVRDEEFDSNWLGSIAQDKKVIAIGETGIDLYRSEDIASHELQKEYLAGHAQVASAVRKPLIIHSRGTTHTLQTVIDDILAIIEHKDSSQTSPRPDPVSGEGIRAVFHCFTGTVKQAQQILEAGYMLSFTGVITFAKELEAVVKIVPLSALMIETDSPYLAPVPYRGMPNEPSYVVEVAKKIAEIHGVEYDEVLALTTKNAKDFFCL